jgi:hypothetical protein
MLSRLIMATSMAKLSGSSTTSEMIPLWGK